MRNDWATIILGDISNFSYGKMPKKELLGTGDYPTFSGYKYQYKYPDYNVEKGDLIIVARGVGGTGDVKLVKERCYLTNLSIKIESDQKQIDNQYFYYKFLLRNLKYLDTGSAQSQITISDLKSLQIEIPSLPEQKAIAHILGTLDDKIELNRKMNETLEEMAQALFKSWFVDFDPVLDKALAAGNEIPEPLQQKAEQRKAVPNEKKLIQTNPELVAAFPDRFTFTEEQGWIPEGWEVKLLSDCTLELRRGISPKYIEEGGVRVVNQKCIRNHEVDYSLTRRNDPDQKKVEGRFVDKGDILINSTGVGTLGRIAPVWEIDEETVVDSHVTLVRADESFSTGFFVYAMLSLEATIEAMGEGSTGQTELSRARVGELEIVIPSKRLQSYYDDVATQNLNKMASNRVANTRLIELRDTLLPKLISGELQVPEAEQIIAEHG